MDLLRAIVCTAVNQLRFAACDRSTLRWAQSQDSEYVCRMFAVSQTWTSALWVKHVAHWTPWKPSGPGLNPQHFLIPSRCIKALRYVTLSHPSWPLTLKVKGHTSWLAQGRDTTFLWISQAAPFFLPASEERGGNSPWSDVGEDSRPSRSRSFRLLHRAAWVSTRFLETWNRRVACKRLDVINSDARLKGSFAADARGDGWFLPRTTHSPPQCVNKHQRGIVGRARPPRAHGPL